METWTEERLLAALRAAGAEGLERVRFRANRSTIWSVTAGGAALNLHEGYRTAPWSCLRHFATIVRRPDRRAARTREAAAAVREWPGLEPALEQARRRGRRTPGGRRRQPGGGGGAAHREGGRIPTVRPGPCCGSPGQIARLRELYDRLNRERFGGRLPPDLHLRLSARMRSRLGHMRGHVGGGRRYVVEIAVAADLMLADNRRCLVDTLLHEMAHAADWLVDGGRGHGSSWRAWARRVGCEARACTRTPVVRRRGI